MSRAMKSNPFTTARNSKKLWLLSVNMQKMGIVTNQLYMEERAHVPQPLTAEL